MKKFWVLWTYEANYSDKCMEISAVDATDARNRATYLYGANFHAKATVYVFDSAPVVFKCGELAAA